MKITNIKSHIIEYDLDEELGYSQQYYHKRSAHLVEIQTDEGIVGWGECFGPGNVAIANKCIVEKVIQPMIIGYDPINREVIWHKVYNLLRDHGQKGMALQALSGIDIALWDIGGKITGQSISKMIGGRHREKVAVYGYGMMLRKEDINSLTSRFMEEANTIKMSGYVATKMKVGLGIEKDLKLAEAVRKGVGDDFKFMVDANHCYSLGDALYVGRGLEELNVFWFEEPVAPEDYYGYKELRKKLDIKIAGGEAEFTRWGWRDLFKNNCLDIAQPEVCALGGISEYLKVIALAHSFFVPVVNHVWGSDIAVATNLQLLAAMPPLPGGLYPEEPILEFDTTDNRFRDDLLTTPLNIKGQVKKNGGYVSIPDSPGIGVEPDRDFIKKYTISE
jgi:D-galactarolactone cycloisomerase